MDRTTTRNQFGQPTPNAADFIRFNTIAERNHLLGPNRLIFIDFMADRFGDVCDDYANEWASRFAKGTAWTCADGSSRAIMRTLAERHNRGCLSLDRWIRSQSR